MLVGELTAIDAAEQAERCAEGWRRDAFLYTGERRQIRLDHARRMQDISERKLAEACQS